MTASPDYPLRFEPLFRRYIWGGRRLGEVLGKPIGAGDDYAESWEVVDHGEDQSCVAAGPLAGRTLGELCREFPDEIYGRLTPPERFPLLLKMLDCHRNLSVQVHPNDAQGARLDPPDLGKTEAWYVLAAEPGAKIYCGLQSGLDAASLRAEIAAGRTEECLYAVEPRPGDCFFIPAGTVHALGAGLLVAEIQQSSDTTFRLFDWNRVGADGKPRQLHVEQALDVIDYVRGPAEPTIGSATNDPQVKRLVECDKFVWDARTIVEPQTIGGDDRFHILAVVEGELRVSGDAADKPLSRGESLLLPAACGATELESLGGRAVVLDAWIGD